MPGLRPPNGEKRACRAEGAEKTGNALHCDPVEGEESMKRILMLGTSLGSREIIRKARERGWHTIVTDNLPPERSTAKQDSDEYWMISTADVEALEKKCREEGIDAVFAGVSEFNLDRVRILADDLHLPCYINPETWTFARNKRLFKRKCKEMGIPVVPEYPIPTPGDESSWERIEYPVVVKPVDGTGNAGLSICRNREELETGIRKVRAISTNPEIILEKYITGEESWNYYVAAEGSIQYAYSGRVFRQPGYPTFLYSFGISMAGGTDDYLARMNPRCTELLRNIGFREGIAWIQCLRDAEGNYYALEMAHRMSADVSGDVLEKCLGFNNVDWMLDTAMGIRHSEACLPGLIRRPYVGTVCVYYLFADHQGRIGRMEGVDRLDPSCFLTEQTIREGDEVRQYQMMVKITYAARKAEEIFRALQEINGTVRIEDSTGGDLIVRYTNFDAVREGLSGFTQNKEK